MSIDLPPLARRSLPVLVAVAMLLLAGCTSWPASRPWEPLLSSEPAEGLRDAAPALTSRERLEALRSPIARERLAAVQAWSDAPTRPLPTEVIDLRTDPDPRVRAAVLTVLARAQPPQALAYLTAALSDNELQVRTAAVTALGELGGTEAQATLEKVAKTDAEVLRAAAVTALANLNAQQAVLEAASDRSWRVRLAVARALRRYPNRPGIALAHRMLNDPSAGVQQEVVKAVVDWPIALAGPLLLEAMDCSSYSTRRTASQELSARWSPANEFLIDGPPERRAEILAQLQQRFREEIGPTEITLVSAAVAGNESSCQPASYIAPADALAQGKAVLAALDRLEAEDVLIRRRAARELAEQAGRQPLGQAALARLASLMAQETDPLVWQDVLNAIASEPRESATQLAYAALRHASPEVRRRGCQHLTAHPDARHTPALLRALADEDVQVAGAAARALGALERLDEIEPLKRLLVHRNELLRLEVAAALTRLKDPAGPTALERLTYSSDPAVRRQLAVVLGEVGGPESLSLLIRLLDDRPDVRRAALESLPKVVGHDVGHPLGQPSLGPTGQASLWKEWFARQSPATPR